MGSRRRFYLTYGDEVVALSAHGKSVELGLRSGRLLASGALKARMSFKEL